MIQRRIALKQMALAAGSLVALPAWVSGWTPASARPMVRFLSAEQENTLADIAETIIPESDTPGARTLGVPAFIQKMVEDCYEVPVQDNLKTALDTVASLATAQFGKPFGACDATQRQALLTQMEAPDQPTRKDAFALVKNLTIQGYTTSEYVLTQHLHYVMIPGHYYGCVPVTVATANK